MPTLSLSEIDLYFLKQQDLDVVVKIYVSASLSVKSP